MLNAQLERLLYLKLFGAMTAGVRQKSKGSPFGVPALAVDLDLSGMPGQGVNKPCRECQRLFPL